LSNDAMA